MLLISLLSFGLYYITLCCCCSSFSTWPLLSAHTACGVFVVISVEGKFLICALYSVGRSVSVAAYENPVACSSHKKWRGFFASKAAGKELLQFFFFSCGFDSHELVFGMK